ncbi:L,D-transpeptidase [uncultured Cohaesibacter sp.]|uniref:L,D-transpeptidase n=1 Tax=uncultured Cohaesibacter sp. TaxID=1002546 RepID=UPI0029C93E3A|nr:L,D-transpeptidase [uncultured Cohaesibacter sp.]
MSTAVIEIVLPSDRRELGELSLLNGDGACLAGPFVAYGKADNARAAKNGNRDRDPLIQWGDTPDGTYDVPEIVRTGENTVYVQRSYGPDAMLPIEPVDGPALQAKMNGRTGLYIHSGDLADSGGLRPTYGCVRLSDDDMRSLLEALRLWFCADDFCSIPTHGLRVLIRPPKEVEDA